MLICKFCAKECKNDNSLRNHERLCPSNLYRVYVNGMTGKKGGNQYTKARELGLPDPVMTDETRKKISEKAALRRHTDASKLNLSIKAFERGLGGHTSKKQMYFKKKNGVIVYLQSSYEIRFAELLEELDIDWERPSPFMWVDDVGVNHRYYPDFKIGDIFIDTKNDFLVIKDARKIELVKEQNNIDLRIIVNNQITKEYIESILSNNATLV